LVVVCWTKLTPCTLNLNVSYHVICFRITPNRKILGTEEHDSVWSFTCTICWLAEKCLPRLNEGHVNGTATSTRPQVEWPSGPQQRNAVGRVVCIQWCVSHERLHEVWQLKLFIIIRQRLSSLTHNTSQYPGQLHRLLQTLSKCWHIYDASVVRSEQTYLKMTDFSLCKKCPLKGTSVGVTHRPWSIVWKFILFVRVWAGEG